MLFFLLSLLVLESSLRLLALLLWLLLGLARLLGLLLVGLLLELLGLLRLAHLLRLLLGLTYLLGLLRLAHLLRLLLGLTYLLGLLRLAHLLRLLLGLTYLLRLLLGLTHLLRLLLGLTHLLGLLPLLALLAAGELPGLGVALGHLVWVLWLSILRGQLLGDLLWRQLRSLLLALGRLLFREADLLVDLPFLLFAPLLVLLWFLNELSSLWVARLQFRLNGLVLAELLAVTPVRGTLVCTAALLSLLCPLLSLLPLL